MRRGLIYGIIFFFYYNTSVAMPLTGEPSKDPRQLNFQLFESAKKYERSVSIMMDLPGPKIRTSNLDVIKIKRGKDKLKDQSYVLWGIPQNTLSRTILTIGDLTKKAKFDFQGN